MSFLGFIIQKRLKLTPLKDIENVNKNTWLSLSDDPHFHVKTKPLRKGWYLLKIQSKTTEFQTAKLYPHQRKQHIDESKAIILPTRPHKPLIKIIRINENKTKLRFDPQEIAGEFTIEKFQLIPLPYFYALYKQLIRIRKFDSKLRKLSLLQVFILKRKQAQKQNIKTKNYIDTIYRSTFHKKETGKNYSSWLERNEKLKLQRFLRNKKQVQNNQIGFSIVLPAYNTQLEHLKTCIKSVINQTHDNWQLCIVDDASPEKSHIKFLKNICEKDTRIQFKQRDQNGHISAASNDALAMCENEYTLLLDHDDTLCVYTLEMFAISIADNPKAQMWYADEDKIDESNFRFMPHFKTDWNPDLLYSQNYIGHPVVFNTERLKNIGGFRVGFEGSQDHDLLLRYTNSLSSDQIIHLPWILYHWRATATSTALNSNTKDYTNESGIKALTDFFESKNKNVKIHAGTYPNTYRCEWPIPDNAPLVSLLIPTRDGYEILKNAITSILEKTNYTNYEIIILDNQTSCSNTLEYFKELEKNQSNIRILNWNYPFNYSAINNFGAKEAYGEIIGLINNDIEIISPNWLTEMVSHAIRPDIGCVGAKLYYSNDKIQHAGVILGIGGVAGHAHKYFDKSHHGYFSRLHLTQNYSAVTAACLIVRKKNFFDVGGLDEQNLTVAFNDIDFCLKVQKAGYRNLFTPWAELYHHESISRGHEDTPEKVARFNREVGFMKQNWSKYLKNDPYYNRNLTLEHENFGLS